MLAGAFHLSIYRKKDQFLRSKFNLNSMPRKSASGKPFARNLLHPREEPERERFDWMELDTLYSKS